MSDQLAAAIDQAWERRDGVTPASSDVRESVEAALELLDSGRARVAEPDGTGGWRVNQWLKKAVLLSFRLSDNAVVDGGAAGAPACVSTLCCTSTSNNSPLMKLANHTIWPAASSTHLLCVPGKTYQPSPSSGRLPSTWISSPRITSGMPSRATRVSPGVKAMVRPPMLRRSSAEAMLERSTGQGK